MPVSNLAIRWPRMFGSLVLIVCLASGVLSATERSKRIVSMEHPRLLGSRAYLQSLATSRPDAYTRVVRIAREQKAGLCDRTGPAAR
jgi:hypothetical protein